MTIVGSISFSCKKKSPIQTIIVQDTLAHILKDLMIVDAGTNIEAQKKFGYNKDSAAAVKYAMVFKKFGKSPAQFEASYREFMKNPTLADSLYSKAIELMVKEQAARYHP